LSTDSSALTAIANDMGYDHVFERQVRALGQPGDMVIGLSTSGSSTNVLLALEAAREGSMVTVLLAGPRAGVNADYTVCVPVGETARIQEAHDTILHTIAAVAERIAAPDLDDDRSTDRYPFILGEDDLAGFAGWMHRSGQVLVTTNGVFDLFHRGHRASLGAAASFGDRLVVLVNTDESVRALGKGPNRPIRPFADRVDDLATMPQVSHVVAMPDADPIRLLSILGPQVHCKGSDYRATGALEEPVVVHGGGRMEYIDVLDGYSTTVQESRISGEASA
jgi:rfaE bifunctional protein nucleotidyltransferase chain/domain